VALSLVITFLSDLLDILRENRFKLNCFNIGWREEQMSDIITPVVYQLGLGAVGGFIVGFALKKLAKLFVVLIGIFVIALLYLSTSGVISINYSALWNTIVGWLGGAGHAASWLVGLISLIPFIGSFMVGFLLGLKIG
jgi:uncharacterized membrane protein (Fun14 family)